MMGTASVFGWLNDFANNNRTTTTAPNKWMILRKKTYSDETAQLLQISSRLRTFLETVTFAMHEKQYFSNSKYPYDLSNEKACHFEMKAQQLPLPVQDRTNASILHAYVLCEDICCENGCCEINSNFLMLIVSLGVSLTLCWLFFCVIFLKWRRPHGKRLSANDYVEMPLARPLVKERPPQQYRTRPARSAAKVRRDDDDLAEESTILSDLP